MLIHFIHRIDNSNIGDLASCPLEYFKYFRQFKIKKHDIYQIDFKSIRKNDIVIIGGGGLFNCLEEWNVSINKVLKICNNVIGWGIGFNTHHGTKTKTSINFSKFKLLSIIKLSSSNSMLTVQSSIIVFQELYLSNFNLISFFSFNNSDENF